MAYYYHCMYPQEWYALTNTDCSIKKSSDRRDDQKMISVEASLPRFYILFIVVPKYWYKRQRWPPWDDDEVSRGTGGNKTISLRN